MVTELDRRVHRPDGCRIAFAVHGQPDAPGVLVSYPWTPGNARYMSKVAPLDLRQLASDADELVITLAAHARVAIFDYPRGIGDTTGPRPGDLTVATVVDDYLAVADAAGLTEFILLGYSWSASAAIHVASRTTRCKALVIGGWPPLDSPHRELRDACLALACDRQDPRSGLAGMYARYYQSLLDEHPAGPLRTTGVLFYGTGDNEPMAGASASALTLIRRNTNLLAEQGWHLIEVPGRDHLGCATAGIVSPIVLTVLSALD
ncbi:MAG TPA: alpha/beta fold hydrolase [Streptosporangiaceae bacterium]|nr:alpha/beta fold hydrolase [Streptosporangiaceae bacterium]